MNVKFLVSILITCYFLVFTFEAQAEECFANKRFFDMKFSKIPAGKFRMGSSSGRNNNERPVHEVTIKSFCMQTTKVTQGQWKEIVSMINKKAGSTVLNPTPWQDKGQVRYGNEYPAVYVSWDDVEKLINKLNALGKGTYRLPTESEWEYAARAGSTSAYYWGDKIDGDYLWYARNTWDRGERYPHKVALKKPNNYGLYDMLGNAGEWVEDKYKDNYKGVPLNGKAYTELGSKRVVRGGGWSDFARYCRSASRLGWVPDSRHDNVGFRLVRTK